MERGRKKNHDTESLRRYVVSYIEETKGKFLVFGDIAEYCNNVLKVTPKVRYYHFTRNPEIKQFIEQVNGRLECRIIGPGGEVVVEEDCTVQADGKGDDEALAEANRRIKRLSEANRGLVEQSDFYKAEVDRLSEQVQNLTELTNMLKKERLDANKVIERLNAEKRKMKSYWYSVAYAPAVQKHFAEIGLISTEEDIKVPEGARFLLDTETCNDVTGCILEYEEKMADEETPKIKVYTKAESESLSKLDKL